MLYWKISHSRRVNALSNPWTMLLYTWLIPCQDNLGRLEGDPDVIKGMVFPKLKVVTEAKVEAWLQALHAQGLLFGYTVNGTRYLQFPEDAREEYQKLVGNMTEASDFPAPPEKDYDAWLAQVRTCMNTFEHVSAEGKGREGKVKRREGNPSAFTAFWMAYPRKEGKHDALKAWERLKPDVALVSRIMSSLLSFCASRQWQDNGGKYIPHASTWLNKRRWEDELAPSAGVPSTTHAGLQALQRVDADMKARGLA